MFLYQPPESERKIKSMPGTPLNRHKEDALKHLARGGFPVNPKWLRHIESIYRNRM